MVRQNNSKLLGQLQEGLKLMRQCPVCEKDYQTDHVYILEEYGGSHLIHMTCPHCQSAVLALVMISPIGMSSIGMMTDLSMDDALRVRDREPIADDDILTLHTALEYGFNGSSFEKLLSFIR